MENLNYKKFIEKYEKESYPLPDNLLCGLDCNYLYVIYCKHTKLTKIGITNNPTVRLMQLQNSSGVEMNYLMVLELEANYDEKPEVIERFLHKYFKNKKTFGEWFSLSIKDILLIKFLLINIEGCAFYDFLKDVFIDETPKKVNPFLGKKSKSKHFSFNSFVSSEFKKDSLL
ncbi:MAG: GIY-YIG nuclease family protein [Pelagibacterales bacterium]|nr:GIY-YIG nuclease family protein [Pelagibacterales bacterium]